MTVAGFRQFEATGAASSQLTPESLAQLWSADPHQWHGAEQNSVQKWLIVDQIPLPTQLSEGWNVLMCAKKELKYLGAAAGFPKISLLLNNARLMMRMRYQQYAQSRHCVKWSCQEKPCTSRL